MIRTVHFHGANSPAFHHSFCQRIHCGMAYATMVAFAEYSKGVYTKLFLDFKGKSYQSMEGEYESRNHFRYTRAG